MRMLNNSTGRSSQRQLVSRGAASQRLATAMGAVIAALACAVALPAHAEAATVAWSTQKPPGACGPARSISTGSGYANIKDCLKIARSASGTYYYNGVLEVDYHRAAGYGGDVLGGKSMIARAGNPSALGVNDCPRERWTYDQKRWCYSPTKTGKSVYGKGVLLDSAGRWLGVVWSPIPSPVTPPPRVTLKRCSNSDWITHAGGAGTGADFVVKMKPTRRARLIGGGRNPLYRKNYDYIWRDLQRCVRLPELKKSQHESLYKQLVCHAVYGKAPVRLLGGPTWDLEAWRPNISRRKALSPANRCNWGGER